MLQRGACVGSTYYECVVGQSFRQEQQRRSGDSHQFVAQRNSIVKINRSIVTFDNIELHEIHELNNDTN